MTVGQQRALERLWPRFGVPLPAAGGHLEVHRLFGNANPVALDIGFGNGEAVTAMALAQPDINLLGIEVHRPGIGQLLMHLESHRLDNVRVICGDAAEVLAQALAPNCLQRVQLFFPDPWPKKKHLKRRIVQQGFLNEVQRILVPQGLFHFATDWQDYAEQVLALCDADPRFCNAAGAGRFTPRPINRPLTKYERRGLAKGHHTWDLVYRRR